MTKTAPWVALATLCLLAPLAASERALAGPTSSHPYFDDGGTLSWFRRLDDARAAAKAEGKLIFVEFGRRECRNCKVLVQKILPVTGVREPLAELCVGLAAECDEPDPRVEALFAKHLPGASALPFVAIATPDFGWICGWQGMAGADEVLAHLRNARTQRPSACARAAAPVLATRTPTTSPAIVAATPRVVPSPVRAVPAAVSPRPASPAPASPAPVAPAPVASRPVSHAPVAPAPGSPARAPVATPTARLAPTAPVRSSPTRSASDLLAMAKIASAAGRHGEVLQLRTTVGTAAAPTEVGTWTALVARADAWAEDCLVAATLAARQHRCDEAARRLADVRREVVGRPAATDAAHGERAVARLKALDANPADYRGRVLAAAEFQGTRWNTLFR